MSEMMRESLSALMDDEANELEIERVLSRIADDPELRQAWVRYNMVRAVASGQHPVRLDLDVSAQVRAALGGEGHRAAGLRQRWLRPLASMAVAASVAATVVLGGQQLAQLGTTGHDSQAIASSVSPVGMVNSLGATSVQASYGTQGVPVLQPATRTAYQELARQRLHKYMQAHAEEAALNSPSGLVPFARVPRIKE
ncbi:MAG: sigma-E factor negative regulatory protein [Halieaceae bacterium]|jgi:sigma-E factor negative regulatory protein RseA|nr:sigma-E factor negative regulatory protein [Halieaceae bacterium]